MGYTREDGCRAWLTYGALNPQWIEKLVEEFGSFEEIYDQFIRSQGALMLPYANDFQMEVLVRQAHRDAMHDMMRLMQQYQMHIIAKDDPVYPDLLREISDAPPLLFYIGNLRALEGDRFVTMVGSRKASRTGIESTRHIACDLSRSGVKIVSGLAVGVDAAAHEGCISGGSPTIGVAACGLDVNYPAENARLKRDILEHGGILLSEFSLGSSALPRNFPIRNRILAGLSRATVMMEAKIKSGTMTTIQHALDQGREVYAFPGEPNSPAAEAAHSLLREGANYFTSAKDILEDMKWGQKKVEAVARQPKAPPPAFKLRNEEEMIYDLLADGEQSFDQLAAASGMDAQSLSGVLTMLQIYGMIKTLPGKLYKRT